MSDELTFDELKKYVIELNKTIDNFVRDAKFEYGNINMLEYHKFKPFRKLIEKKNQIGSWDRSKQLLTDEERNKYKSNVVRIDREYKRLLKPITTIRKEIAEAKKNARDETKRGFKGRIYMYKNDLTVEEYPLRSLNIDDIRYSFRQAITSMVENNIECHHISIGPYYSDVWKVKVWETDNDKFKETYLLNKSFKEL